mmetsp:Transcript_12571/g.20505  ORF Transcript_12571/g.20505 Transcript_12571/m.20505 type:complete len:485 (-) Transcript_12571:80-1534(-)
MRSLMMAGAATVRQMFWTRRMTTAITPKPGTLDLNSLSQFVKEGKVDTVLTVFTDHYGQFMGKRIDGEFFLESVYKSGAHACDYLLTVDMEMEPVGGYKFSNWEKGYGDVHLVPDLGTLRVCSWLNKTALVQCDVHDQHTHALVEVAPRSILRKVTESAKQKGFLVNAASELEYFLYMESYRKAHEKKYSGLIPSGWYREDYHILQGTRGEMFHGAARRHLRESGIPVETSKGETGLGQHEVNIRFSEILTMADRHAVYKLALKEIAEQAGLSVTFMAKPHFDQAGSGCHIHLSLHDKDTGKNLFQGDHQLGRIRCSDLFRWFLGGWIAHAPSMMALYAPTVNSYKRFIAGSWAPTALAWSYDNRTAGFRIVGEGKSLRIECRLPGADCNPYMALAASLASGLDGIENKIEPPPMLEGDAYKARNVTKLPSSLGEAAEMFEGGLAKKTFGEAATFHYTHFFRTEQEAYNKAVTDWEMKRYFERI